MLVVIQVVQMARHFIDSQNFRVAARSLHQNCAGQFSVLAFDFFLRQNALENHDLTTHLFSTTSNIPL